MCNARYAGFWIRLAASLIDSLLIAVIIGPILLSIYGVGYFFSHALVKGFWDVLLQLVFPAVAVIIFWVYRSATPGKDIADIKIVDANTGGTPSAKQCVIRYLAYYLSLFPLCLGFLAIAFDRRKRGWHDRLANTVVLYKTDKSAAGSES